MDPEDRAVATIDPGPREVLGPGHDFGTVTDKIGGVVYRPFLKTPTQMFIGFACAFLLVNVLLVAVTWLFCERRRHLGHHDPRRLGIRDRQFRLVDRYRTRRHVDFGHSAAAQTGLAHLDQPLFGSDDAVRRRLRRHVPDPAPGPPVAGLLADSLSEHDVAVAAAAQPADLGRVRGLDLRDRLVRCSGSPA